MVGGVGTAAKQGRVHYAKATLKDASAAPSAGHDAPASRRLSTGAAAKETPPAASVGSEDGNGKPKAAPDQPSIAQEQQQDVREQDERKQKTPPMFEVAFDVMSWPPNVNFECIIGIDFLARYKAKIDLFSNTLQLCVPDGEDVFAKLRRDGAASG